MKRPAVRDAGQRVVLSNPADDTMTIGRGVIVDHQDVQG